MKMSKIRVYLDWLRKDCAKQWVRAFRRTIPNYDHIKLGFQSLFYNEHAYQSLSYKIDTLLEPCFWFVDNFTSTLGPIFVFLVVFLIFLYVLIAYVVGLSYWLAKSHLISILALVIGNYLLINAMFHYFMAWKTSPGFLPSNIFIKNSVSICKKCILPKPPRTHHCSVCDKCILSMDHHCPWLNNCIGHFNHRYFFMFCMFAWLGTLFVIIFGFPIFLNHFYNIDIFGEQFKVSDLFQPHNYLNASTKLDTVMIEMDEYMQHKYFNRFKMNYKNVKNNFVIFELLLTVGAFIAIAALMAWHARMINRGETCIESLRNKKERARSRKNGERFVNPFNKGALNNWRRFFGLDQEGVGLRCIFFPSCHKPYGNGIEWPDVYY